MKRISLLLVALSATSLVSLSQSMLMELPGKVMSETGSHAEHNEGRLVSTLSKRDKTRASDLDVTAVTYNEPANLFTMGYTPNLSYYSHVVRRGAAYSAHTWRNTSDALEAEGYSFVWTYDSPEGPGQGGLLLNSNTKDLTVTYPFNNGWWCAPVLSAKKMAELTYSPSFKYRFGGPSVIIFNEGALDFGMTTYSEMLYRDVNGKRTTTFGSLKYLPTASDPYSVTKWTPVFPDKKDLKMKGFYNIFHKPDAPYAITKIWGWIEYTALKETKLTMTLYKLDEKGEPTDVVIAVGENTIKAGADKSILFNLKRPGTDGDMSPITIDCGFIAVLEGFSTEGAFSKLQPILGSGTVWEGGDECPWAYNCGVMLSWNEGGAEKQGYFHDSKIYDEGRGSTKKLCACDFLWMVDGDFAWIFEKSGISELTIPLTGGSENLTFNTYYPLNDTNVTITKDAEWLDFSVSAASEVASDNGLKVTASPSDEAREGYITISGPAMNYVLKVKQTDSSAVESISVDDMIIATEYMDIAGRMLDSAPSKGVFIKVDIYSNGERKVSKCIK